MKNLSANSSLPGSHQDLFSPGDEDSISSDLEENDVAATATTRVSLHQTGVMFHLIR
jgi:hypothetical protein